MDLTDAKQSGPLHAESPLRPHCTTSTPLGDPQHGGALFVLPLEIRDEVYRLVRKGGRGSYVRSKTHATRIKTPESHYALLAVSKAIGQEFLERWLSDPNNGRYRLLSGYGSDSVVRLPPRYTDCMKDLEMDICYLDQCRRDSCALVLCHHFSDSVWGISTKRLEPLVPCDNFVKAAIAPFTGAHIERNSLEVNIRYYNPDTMAVLSSPGFETFKALVGFRTVTFRVGGWQETTKVISLMLEGIKEVLEPSLGPAIEDHDYCRIGLVFRPRDNLVERVR